MNLAELFRQLLSSIAFIDDDALLFICAQIYINEQKWWIRVIVLVPFLFFSVALGRIVHNLIPFLVMLNFIVTFFLLLIVVIYLELLSFSGKFIFTLRALFSLLQQKINYGLSLDILTKVIAVAGIMSFLASSSSSSPADGFTSSWYRICYCLSRCSSSVLILKSS